jgi:inorganic phosphate transporter, PiT family
VLTLLLVVATCFLAYSNGANDNFKGVASLFGSRTTTYRTAIAWATVTTFGGSLCSLLLAQALLAKFSVTGIVPDQMAGSERFVLAVALGAGLTIIIATLMGYPDAWVDRGNHGKRAGGCRRRGECPVIDERLSAAVAA